MVVQYYDPFHECMPLAELVSYSERRLVETRTMERASRSLLYQERWATAGVLPSEICSYADLRRIPLTNGSHIRQALERFDPQQLVCSESVRLWASTSGTTGMPKWIPRADEDLAFSREMIGRFAYMGTGGPKELPVGVLGGGATLGFNAPAPAVTDALPATSALDGMLLQLPGETIPINYTEAEDALLFSLRRKPQYFVAFPSIAMRVAEVLGAQAPAAARRELAERFTLTRLLAYLVTRVKKIRPRDLLPFQWGVFSGEPLEPYRQAIRQAFGFEPSDAYASTEFLGMMRDCFRHEGIHLWLDCCLAELLPEEEIERTEANPEYLPRTIPIWKADPGQRGDLVVTNFAQAFPLVRYRTSDLVQVVSAQCCACGRTHPRIRILHRSDDVVNVGIARFSIVDLQQQLEGAPGLQRWQLRVGRTGYKPRMVLQAEVSPRPAEEAAWKKQALERLLSVGDLRVAFDNRLILEPIIEIVSALAEQRTYSGKLRRVIYEEDTGSQGGNDGTLN
ncbi:MAG: GH3 auxin-responsive promoter family protein [Coprothermobacterota bacterium]|nr:GH3 auxin-responsive promoter family protein [Coprothermobacterota bacterium]